MRTRGRRLARLLLALAVVLVPQAAPGHARLTRSEPADGARVAAPAALQLWFDERLEAGFHTVRVSAFPDAPAGGSPDWAAGPPAVDRDDSRHLSVPLRPLPPGRYGAAWRVLSRDGHTAAGRIVFTVLPAP